MKPHDTAPLEAQAQDSAVELFSVVLYGPGSAVAGVERAIKQDAVVTPLLKRLFGVEHG